MKFTQNSKPRLPYLKQVAEEGKTKSAGEDGHRRAGELKVFGGDWLTTALPTSPTPHTGRIEGEQTKEGAGDVR